MSRKQDDMFGYNGPRPSIVFGLADAHLLGKLIDEMDEVAMRDLGFSEEEIARAEWVFEELDEFLNEAVGEDWNEVEVGEVE